MGFDRKRNATVPLLVYITGKLGAGKSKVAEKWGLSAGAKIVSIDEILKVGGKKFDSEFTSPCGWDFWNRIKTHGQQEECLQHALTTIHNDLKGHLGDVVVEGSILCQDRFFDGFERVLLAWMHPGEWNRHFFYINPPDDVIFQNVRRRGRRKELEEYKTVEDVKRKHRGFEEAIKNGKNPWKENTHRTSEALLAALGRLRSSSKR
jgi:hypothetical protein